MYIRSFRRDCRWRGLDGLPRVYLIFREVKREIGDDAQFIAELFPITGRVFSARFSPDETYRPRRRVDHAGELVVCSYDYNEDASVARPYGKWPRHQFSEEQKQLDDYKEAGHP